MLPDLDITLTVTLTDDLSGRAAPYTAAEWPACRGRVIAHCLRVQLRHPGSQMSVSGNLESGRVVVLTAAGKRLTDYRWETVAAGA